MANHNQNGGRNGAVSDEPRSSWRPQDASPGTRTREAEDDRDYRAWRDHGFRDDDRAAGERESRRWDAGRGSEGYRSGDPYDDRDTSGRSTERYGQGQSGYSAGRYGDDRSQHVQMQNRNDMAPSTGGRDDRNRDLGTDDRFTGRGRPGYWQDRTGYEGDRYGGQDSREVEAERRGGSRASRYDERMGYPVGSYGRGPGGHGSPSGGQDVPSRGTGPEPHIHRGTGPHRGKGPAGYQRSDERIRELVCELLTEDDQIDATHIEVSVSHGEVTLSGTVDDRRAKREAEDCACSAPGVRDVQNLLRVRDDQSSRGTLSGGGQGSGGRHEPETSGQDKKHRS
ncbi:MAG TPA: BON domain-containing protein [Kofleriaceae bacterium]